MAIWRRKPKHKLLWHTDRGSQYASKEHRDLLKDHGIIQSMSRKGNCWDNAPAESFFHTLKTFAYHLNLCRSSLLFGVRCWDLDRKETRHDIFDRKMLFPKKCWSKNILVEKMLIDILIVCKGLGRGSPPLPCTPWAAPVPRGCYWRHPWTVPFLGRILGLVRRILLQFPIPSGCGSAIIK